MKHTNRRWNRDARICQARPAKDNRKMWKAKTSGQEIIKIALSTLNQMKN